MEGHHWKRYRGGEANHVWIADLAKKSFHFLSERSVQPQWDSFDFQNNFDRTTRIYLITLAAATPAPLPVESDEEPGSVPDEKPAAKPGDAKPAEEAKPGEAKGEEAKTAASTPPAPKLPDVKVDLEGIAFSAGRAARRCGSL